MYMGGGGYIHDAVVTACVFSGRAQTMPLSEQQQALFPSNSGTSVLLSQWGGGTTTSLGCMITGSPTDPRVLL